MLSSIKQHPCTQRRAEPVVSSRSLLPLPPLLSGRIHSKVHMEIIKPHKCPHCSTTFANTSYLAQHLRIHSGAKPYNCSYCQKAFRQLSHLQQHTR